MSVNFPTELRDYFLTEPQSDNKQNLADLFNKYPSVRQAFISWSENHSTLVQYEPRLYEAFDIAKSSNADWKGVAKTVNTVYLEKIHDESLSSIHETLNGISPSNVPEHYVEYSFELFEAGILSIEQLKKVLSVQDESGHPPPLSSSEKLKHFIPLLEKLEFNHLKAILSIPKKDGSTLLHDPKSIQVLLPLLEQLEFGQFKEILSIRNEHKHYNSLPLSQPNCFQAFQTLLEKLEPSQLYEILLMREPDESSILFNDKVLELVVPLMETLESQQIKDILSIRDDVAGYSPLFDSYNLQLMFPLFEKMEFEDFKEVLSITCDGNTPLHNPDDFQTFIPLLELLTPHQLKEVLSIQNDFGATVVQFLKDNEEFASCVVPLLEKLESDDLREILSIQNKRGLTTLHGQRSIQSFIPLLEKLEPGQLIELFSIQDEKGNTVLHYPDNFKLLIPLFEKLEFKQLEELLSIKDNAGKPPLHFKDANKFGEILIKMLSWSDEKLNLLFSIEDADKNTLLHNPSIFYVTKSLFFRLDPKVFEIQNHLGLVPGKQLVISSHWLTKDKTGDRQVPLSEEKLSGEKYQEKAESIKRVTDTLWNALNFADEIPKELLGIKIEEKDVLLSPDEIKKALDKMIGKMINKTSWSGTPPADHKEELHQFYSQMLTNFDQLLSSLQNQSPIAQAEFLISVAKTELEGLSATTYQAEIEKEKEKKYQEKAESIKRTTDELWSALNFDDEIPTEFLGVKIKDNDVLLSPDEIKKALDEMIGKMINKTPWLGTPPADQKEELHQFYSQMLTNFDQLLSSLQHQSPIVQAGSLISVAKTELEGRCAAAYQAEIEQANMLQGQEMNTGIQFFDKKAQYSLINAIESIVRTKYSGNSHQFGQMLYAAGLAPTPDPLPLMTVEDCQSVMFEERIGETLIANFKESSLNASEAEFVELWFCEYTPEDYGAEFLTKQATVKAEEQEIVDSFRKVFENKGMSTDVVAKVLTVFQSTQGGAVRFHSLRRDFVGENIFQMLNQARSLKELEEIQELHNKERDLDRLRMIELQTTPNPQEKALLQRKNIGVRREFEAAKALAENRILLRSILESGGTVLSDEDFDLIVANKQEFDKKISELAIKDEIDFSPRESGLPSQALDRMRRLAYAAEFFATPKEINTKGSIKILSEIGVLELSDVQTE